MRVYSNLFDKFAALFRIFLLPFIAERSEDGICDYERKAETPYESNCVEEVGVSGPGVDP